MTVRSPETVETTDHLDRRSERPWPLPANAGDHLGPGNLACQLGGAIGVDRQESTGDPVGQLDEHTTAAEQEHVAQPGPAVHAGERLGVPADHRLDRHGGIDLVTTGDRAQVG